MSLADLLEKQFRADLRFRGEAYFKADRVVVQRVRVDSIDAIVRDGEDYHTHLDRTGGKFRQHCSCVQFQKFNLCKHLWATILAVDSNALLSAPPRPGHIPPFAAEPVEPLFPMSDDMEDEDDFIDIPAKDLVSRASSATAVEEPVATRRRLKDWERSLTTLSKEFEGPARTKAAESRDREIFYEIDEDASRQANLLVIQVSQRQRRVNGQWGKLKALKFRPSELNQLDHEDDRTILAYMFGGTPDRSDWTAQRTENSAAVSRFHVPHELCVRLLPLICGTKRLRFVDDSEGLADPISWDDAGAWDLTVNVARGPGGDDWQLSGEIVRDEEKKPLSAARMLVPGGLVILGNQIAKLRDFEAYAWVHLLRSGEPVIIPDGDEIEFVDRMLDMPVLPRLDLPEELHLEEVRTEPTYHLTIQSPGGHGPRTDRLLALVEFGYMGSKISGTSDRWAIVQREEGRCLLRDTDKEEAAWMEVLDAGFRRRLDHGDQEPNVEISSRELGAAVRGLVDSNWDVRAEGRPVAKPSDMQFKIKSGIDWFELHASVDFKGHSAPFPEILAALARGDSTIRLDDGSLGVLPEEWAAQFGLLAGLGATEGDHLRFEMNQVALLDVLLEQQTGVEYDEQFSDMREKFRSFDGISVAKEPDGFAGELRPYQQEGLGWLRFLEGFRLGGCLADDMGLGKTIQFLGHLQHHRFSTNGKNGSKNKAKNAETQPHKPSMVIVPKSLLFNWLHESERFTPNLKVLEYTGPERHLLIKELPNYDLVVTTYGTLRRDVMLLKDVEFDYIVLDEAQTIKNSTSQVAKASRLLKSTHRLALTGTPIENHLGDLWSIFEFLNPGMLGRSRVFKNHTGADDSGKDSRAVLAKALRPFILRRTKSQVARDLPDKTEQILLCDMGEEQEKTYDELRTHYRESLLGRVRKDGLNKSRMHVLEALLRLRQAACHPGLLDPEKTNDAAAKTDVLLPRLEELIEEGHKALVFSQFTSMLAIVREQLDKAGMKYEYLDGQTRDRETRVKNFQENDDCGIFLISLKAGGLGLNLTAADYVFLLDPWWNPAVEAQAIDRAHRLGQDRHVFAYRLIVRNSVEEKIAKLQQQKRELASMLLDAEASGGLGDLTTEDLELLLS
ncbi:DEAD/DEAH box helicase [Calycomorphotria hydatis]|uniref:ATP-dependent helicase HepA n=1 Tax=Calycomorphotria hydatis TaxID=2528027 RepID=A0A517T9I2_9PLAN|nr:DEAD/DEAH box helicase [Calycomorphotria hydatis]QDT65040.1 hypothetical protein V22_22860 [Calycomorphotria hydatis]